MTWRCRGVDGLHMEQGSTFEYKSWSGRFEFNCLPQVFHPKIFPSPPKLGVASASPLSCTLSGGFHTYFFYLVLPNHGER